MGEFGKSRATADDSVNMGTAGYGDEGWSVGQSYGQAPIYMPAIYE